VQHEPDEEDVAKRTSKFEYDKLTTLWEVLVQGRDIRHPTTDEDGIHIPPALAGWLEDRLEIIDAWAETESRGDREDYYARYSTACTNLLAWTFRLGQLCAQINPPFLYESLTPCRCGKITDEDIRALLGEEK